MNQDQTRIALEVSADRQVWTPLSFSTFAEWLRTLRHEEGLSICTRLMHNEDVDVTFDDAELVTIRRALT